MMRYAIYFAPAEESDFNRLGSSWLGRDAYGGEAVVQPEFAGLEATTREPSRYGFHATLKAPFALKAGCRRTELGEATRRLAKRCSQVTITNLGLTVEHGFLALVPEQKQISVSRLADHCVRELDDFRAAADEQDMLHRNKGLNQKQRDYLRQWGYPYVLEEFNLHFTLSGQLPPNERETWAANARQHFAPVLGRSIKIDSLSIFIEPNPGSNFTIEEQFPLGTTLQISGT